MGGRLFRMAVPGAVILLAGCAYQRGIWEDRACFWGQKESPCRIAVAPVRNLSLAPQAEGIFSEQLHRYFLRTPGWELVEESEADVVLEVTLGDFGTHSGRRQDGHLQSLGLSLDASASLRSVGDNRYFFQNIPFRAGTHYEIAETEDLYYAAVPLLTRELAEQIGRAVSQPWPMAPATAPPAVPSLSLQSGQ